MESNEKSALQMSWREEVKNVPEILEKIEEGCPFEDIVFEAKRILNLRFMNDPEFWKKLESTDPEVKEAAWIYLEQLRNFVKRHAMWLK